MSLFSVLERPVPDLTVKIETGCSPSSVEPVLQADQDEELGRATIYRDLTTRNISLACLCLGWVLGIASLTTGTCIVATSNPPLPSWLVDRVMNMGMVDYPFPQLDLPLLYIQGHRVYCLPRALVFLISFLLNIVLTAILDGMNFIHSTTLRWNLWRESRLQYNSNPRLFSCARSSDSPYANRWFGNVLSALSLALSYGATSLLTFNIYIRGVSDGRIGVTAEKVDGDRYGLDINGWAVVGLGIGLLIQAAISTSCLLSSRAVETWSCNPFTNAKACALLPTPNLPPLDSSLEQPTLAQPTQPSALTIIPSIRATTRLLYLFTLILLACTATTALIAYRAGRLNRAYVISQTGRADVTSYFQALGQLSVPYYLPRGNPYDARQDYVGLLIQVAAQALLTLDLHGAEAVVAIVRDEKVWRRASQRSGARFDAQDSFVHDALTCWEMWVLSAFKALANCVFGFAVSCNLFVFVAVLPLGALVLLAGILAGCVDVLARWQPRGTQPVAFGDLGRLGRLVSSWGGEVEGRLFWGDLGVARDMGDGDRELVRTAGTAGRKLDKVKVGESYVGLGANLVVNNREREKVPERKGGWCGLKVGRRGD